MRLSLVSACAAVVASVLLWPAVGARGQDVPIAIRQPIRCGATGAIYPYYNLTDQTWHCATTSPAFFNGNAVTSTAAELNLLHGATATAAEHNKLAGVTGGVVSASKAAVVDANKAVDTLRAITDRTLGGTGVPGAAVVQDELTKTVTGIANAAATDVLTVTVPNAKHLAQIEVCATGSLGAGGAIGAGEAAATNCYIITVVRTAGVATVATASTAFGAAASAVAGATTATATLGVSGMTGAVGATQTFTIQITITRGGGSSANHVAHVSVRLLNGFSTGIVIS